MTGTILDSIEDEDRERRQFLNYAASSEKEPEENLYKSSVFDLGKTILKGSVEGFSRFGTALGPTQPREVTEMQLAEQTKKLDEALPTEDGFISNATRRGLKELPIAVASPGANAASMINRSMVAGFLGEGGKELGLPEWAQSALELTAYIGPDITKKLLESGTNADLIQFAKRMGMTDAQITPLIQSDFKTKWLAKLTQKGGSTGEKIASTKSGIQQVYTKVKDSPLAQKEISEIANGKLINSLKEKISDMPREVQDVILQDLNDLLANKITGKSLINFYSDVNHNLGGKTTQLAQLKNPIKEALATLSPELVQDFEMANKLYERYYPIASKLKPNLVSNLITAGKALGLGTSVLTAVTTGIMTPLVGFATEKVIQKLSQQMLTNPHFQQLGQKFANAISQNKFQAAKLVVTEISKLVSKVSPELGKDLEKLSMEELQDLFSSQETNTEKFQ